MEKLLNELGLSLALLPRITQVWKDSYYGTVAEAIDAVIAEVNAISQRPLWQEQGYDCERAFNFDMQTSHQSTDMDWYYDPCTNYNCDKVSCKSYRRTDIIGVTPDGFPIRQKDRDYLQDDFFKVDKSEGQGCNKCAHKNNCNAQCLPF